MCARQGHGNVCCRAVLRNALGESKKDAQQAAAAASDAEQALKIVQQELTECQHELEESKKQAQQAAAAASDAEQALKNLQQELASVEQDLVQWPDAWCASAPSTSACQ